SVRSSGAGTICTVTVAVRAVLSRSSGSSRPSVTACRTSAFAPLTGTGAVRTSVARSTADSGPMTSAVIGSAVISPTEQPGAGRESTDGTMGTSRVTDASNAIATAAGSTCTTSTPNGTRT